jgi:hypothetical protein
MDANFTTMAFNFENLLGGGDLGATINEIMGQLGSSIFEQVAFSRLFVTFSSVFDPFRPMEPPPIPTRS